MKNIIAIIAIFCMAHLTYAQPWSPKDVQQGEIARDFIKLDYVNELPYHLYDMLDSGKTVYIFSIQFSSESAWAFHNTNALQNLYNLHGPVGDNTIQVFASSPGGLDEDALYGVGIPEYTAGNWLENMNYPYLTVSGQLKGLGQGTRIYRICPDRRMYCTTKQLDQLPLSEFPTVEELEAGIGMCELSSVATDAKIVFSNADTLANCGSEQRAANAYLCNMGTEPLTSCEIVAAVNGEVVQSVNWTGNLAAYQLDTISFNDILTPYGQANMRFYVQNPNGIADQNLGNDTLYRPLAAPVYWDSDTIFMELQVDAGEIGFYWDIQNSAGTTIDFGGDSQTASTNGFSYCTIGCNQYNAFSYITKAIVLPPEDDCYTIRLLDAGANGLGTWYNLAGDSVGTGYMRFKKGNEVIFEYGRFGRRAYGKFSTSPPISPIAVSYAIVNTTNMQPNGSINITTTGGLPPYEYSKDCGANFGSSSDFSGLLAGFYCMTTKDAAGQTVTDTVEVQNVNDALFASYAVTHTTNGLANGSITVTASGGVAPYQYSNDCGANFGSSNLFGSLAAGTYCMITKDAIGQTVTDSVVVNSSISATDAPRGLSGLSVRPNPARDIVNIGFVLSQSSNIGIEVFNEIGQQVVSMPTRVYATGQQSVSIDVAVLPTGLYFVVLQDERGTSTARFEKR